MIRRIALALLLAAPALAQSPRCGFGLGLEALRGAERPLQAGIAAADLLPGRDAAEAAAAALAEAAGRFEGCGCRQAAELVREATGLAEQARSETGLDRLRRVLERARFSAGRARDGLGRRGCG
ncbi:hypothetical protein ACFQS7_01680 [Dankookia sp. GCM10030260]|uniref:hypothetical protein n=1 Tax=Dankookia sp. GCM10030260 TaxID=3273390 RepID=UPI00360DA2DA